MMKLFKYVLIASLVHCFAFAQAQTHVELLDGYNGDLAMVAAEMESLYRQGIVSDRDYKHYNRWLSSVSLSVGPNGKITNTMARNRAEYARYVKEHKEDIAQTRAAHGFWVNATPDYFDQPVPTNGRVNCIAVHPTNDNIIYIGTAYGGVWKTTNGGSSWSNLTDGTEVLAVSSLAIDHTNANHIYMLTGDGDGRAVPSIGILESFDGGLSWRRTGLEWTVDDLNYGYKLLMDPANANRMFITSTDGVYRTLDGWNTWERVLTANSRDIEFKPGDTDVVYVTRARYVTQFATYRARVYRSLNGGDSWSLLLEDHGLPDDPWTQRIEIAVSPDDPNMVAALYAEKDSFNLFVSFTSADTFFLFSNEPNITGGQPWYDLVIEADPTDASEFFAGGVKLWHSNNYGVGGSWDCVADCNGTVGIHPDIHAIHHDGTRILLATDGGIVQTLDGGATWTDLTDGITIMQFYYIDVRPGSEVVMGGTQDNGTMQWTVGDVQGDNILGSDGMACFFHPTEVDAYYASSQTNRWRWDLADSAAWTFITPPSDTFPHWESAFIMDANNPDTLFSASRNISRSYDRGDNWVDLNPGFDESWRIESMSQCADFPYVLMASNRYQVKLTSTLYDAAPVWFDRSEGLPIGSGPFDGNVSGIEFHPANPFKVWVTLSGYFDGDKVFYSDDAGLTWENISGTLPNVPVHCIKYKPGSNEDLYIGTDLGVFYRNANMDDWVYFSNGLPTVQVRDIAFEGIWVYAGTYGRGMWRSINWATCPDHITLTPGNDTGGNSTGIQYYSANNTITSTRIVTGGPGSDVTYQAGDFVRLDPGFHVKATNQLHVKVEGCPD